jgi:hypothetical protein
VHVLQRGRRRRQQQRVGGVAVVMAAAVAVVALVSPTGGGGTDRTIGPPPTVPTLSATPGSVVLSTEGIAGERFGAKPEIVLTKLTASLGPPDPDRGWLQTDQHYVGCPGTELRKVEWKRFGLTVSFTDGPTDHAGDGVQHLIAWELHKSSTTTSLRTAEGARPGMTLAELHTAYPQQVEVTPGDPVTVRVARGDGLALLGTATGRAPSAQVETLAGGQPCAE